MFSRSRVISVSMDRQRQAISRSVKFSGVIWSSGEYLVLAASWPKWRHSVSAADCASCESRRGEREHRDQHGRTGRRGTGIAGRDAPPLERSGAFATAC